MSNGSFKFNSRKNIGRDIRTRWLIYLRRITPRFEGALMVISALLSSLTSVFAVISIVVIVVYFGYNLSATDASKLIGVLRIARLVFTVEILFHLLFFFRSIVSNSRAIKWIVDVGVLFSMLLSILRLLGIAALVHLPTFLVDHKFMFLALGAFSVVEICYVLSRIPGRRTNPSILMAASFLIFILLGSMVLMLPRCTYHGISYTDSLFIASSAVSITGLTSVDVPSTFTPMGIVVLSVLIQLGSLGIITFTSFFALFFTGNTSIYNQLLLRDVIYSKSMNALVPTLLYVLGFTVTIELAGAVAVFFTVPEALGLDLRHRIFFSVFHSMSSFCNAGFSSVPLGMSNPAFMKSNQIIYIVTSILVFAGSVGFPILTNLKEIVKSYIRKFWCAVRGGGECGVLPVHIFDLNTKIVLCTTLTVLAIGTASFFFLEYDNTLRGMTLYEKTVQSIFNSLIPRSAGFSSVNPSSFLNITILIVVAQMIIGGSSQSMAGGIKVNTLGAIFLNLRAVVRGQDHATAFHRTISRMSIRRANAVVSVSAFVLLFYLLVIMYAEPLLPAKKVIFEVISAFFTVGSSLGITSELSDFSKVVLSTAMFFGRVGILSILAGTMGDKRDVSPHYPADSIIIN